MTSQAEILQQLEVLLNNQDWRAARHTAEHLIRQPESRAIGDGLLTLLNQFPEGVEKSTYWQKLHAWAAFRAGEMQTLQRLVDGLPPQEAPGLKATVAAENGRWEEALQLWQQFGRKRGYDLPEQAVLARFRAKALAVQGCERWQAAFQEAEQLTPHRRDQGILLLEYGHHLSQAGADQQARQAFVRASALLAQDPSLLRLCYANLGIVCLRLGDHLAAEKVLKQAAALADRTDGQRYLSTAWRGLGGLYLSRKEWPRAAHAYGMAELKAQDVRQTITARRSLARLERFRGHIDQANMTIHQALVYLDWSADMPHPLYIDLAEGRLLQGQIAAAEDLRPLFRIDQPSDAWRQAVIEAEIQRLSGHYPELPSLIPQSQWWQEQALLFPELMAEFGLTAPAAPEWAVTLSADGPLQLKNVPLPTPVPVNHPALRLLAYLIHRGGSAGMERILEDLEVQGKTARLRQQNVSRLVGKLRAWLGWPESVMSGRQVLRLAPEPRWSLIYPPPERADLFCEGCYDPWILEWRSEHSDLGPFIPE